MEKNHTINDTISMNDSISSNQKTEAEQSEKLIQENQKKINTMEVHHPIGSHSKKHFQDYFFEFLMLFLAVSAGYFCGKHTGKLF